MKVAAAVSTKGGPGKTTVGANLGAFCADAGVRTLLIDLDNQPSLPSFYNLSHDAPGGAYQLHAADGRLRLKKMLPACFDDCQIILTCIREISFTSLHHFL